MGDNFIEKGQKKYDDITIPEDLELNLMRTLKKANTSRNSKPIIKILGGFSAAVVIFILLINISPSFAYALNNIPLLKNLVQLVRYDKGFNNLVNSDRVQELNLTAEDKGARFTVTNIIGDDSKLWIGYNFQGEGLFIGQIKFTTKNGSKDLMWGTLMPTDHENYIDVSVDKLVKDFVMEIPVYKDNPSFHKPFNDFDEEELENMKVKLEQNKLTTLTIPISLNNKVYKDDMIVIDENKEFKSAIGTFRVSKLKLSESRSTVYLELLSDDYELIKLESPMLVDDKGNEFYYPSNYDNLSFNNNIALSLEGGIRDTGSLTFKCSGIKYLNKKDKQITIDIKNKMIGTNNLGIQLVSIEDNSITLNRTKGNVDFDFHASSGKGKNIAIENITTNSLDGKQVLKFKNLNDEKIILNVIEAENSRIDGFDLKLND